MALTVKQLLHKCFASDPELSDHDTGLIWTSNPDGPYPGRWFLQYNSDLREPFCDPVDALHVALEKKFGCEIQTPKQVAAAIIRWKLSRSS